jgi:hypothetical protein
VGRPPAGRPADGKRQLTTASCRKLANARKRGRCLVQVKRAKAIATCKRSTRGRARVRCIARAKRRFA